MFSVEVNVKVELAFETEDEARKALSDDDVIRDRIEEEVHSGNFEVTIDVSGS